ncbi:hypothetical protein Bca101_026325 [Brassica carinata]
MEHKKSLDLKHIWNLKTAPKLKDFLWRVVRKAIPVSANFERRGVASFKCKSCDGFEDDLHVFLNCPLAVEVWNQVPVRQRPSPSLPTVAELIRQGITYIPLPPSGVTNPLWPWILWNLWKARNQFLYENRVFTAAEIVLKSIRDSKEWNDAQLENEVRIPPENSSRQNQSGATRPPPPSFPPGFMVVKVDAAWDAKTGNCGIGAIYSGEALVQLPVLSEGRSHVSSAIMAETIAVHRAVSSAVYSNVRSLAVLSDSLSLINLLKAREYQPELFGIMFDIYRSIPLFDVISFTFLSRNFNIEADLVAKSALDRFVMSSTSGG